MTYPTHKWRVQGVNSEADTAVLGPFDEIVVGEWLHIEMMDERRAWLRIGNEIINVRIKPSGAVELRFGE